MPAGRCSGCGLTGSRKKIEQHVASCQQYLELYQADPDRCLDPTSEYERYQDVEGGPEARAVRRDERLTERFAEMDRQQSIHAARWQRPRDILED